MIELNKSYNPKDFEDEIYKLWIENDAFKAEIDHEKTPYTIVMPPPNITGQLHMGHALDNTLQDVIIRHKRMSGFVALWLPGTDHAAIATEAKVVEMLAKKGINKQELGREKFLEHVWDWKNQYGGRIVQQLEKLGCSCDWSRQRFTMDEQCNRAVTEVFYNLYNKGLIYRGERIINWCPNCRTSISDAEVEFEEKDGHFWHIRYNLTDGSGHVVIATTRPETLLGDTAVAVNPADTRYKHLIGKKLTLPLVGREIAIIADEYVEKDFGTGVVKITPAHDPNDFEVGIRHNLPIQNVMTDDAKIVEEYTNYAGMDRYTARIKIVEDLEKSGNLCKIEEHKHNVGTCSRCNTVVEPRVSKQWFVKMQPLAEPAIKAVQDAETKFIPPRFNKIYFHWLENIKDWCISRQLWWGHQIPAFYCDSCNEIYVSKENITKCINCGGELRQDQDTLDTWFSSALWPFSTLGFPDKTQDLAYFYPTDTLVTGYDIIFFWVVRMMFSGIEHMSVPPFKNVLIHGLVRDELGRKMSKSLGNGIDPLVIVDKYGADALRFTLAFGTAPGNDMRFSEQKIKTAAGFANKLWNASRFVMMNLPDNYLYNCHLPNNLNTEDKWLISKLNRCISEMEKNINSFEIGLAAEKIQSFIWDVFCDWYIEISKPKITNKDEIIMQILVYTLSNILKLLHPFMPFITEEIWKNLTNNGTLLINESFPKYTESNNFESAELDFQRTIDIIRAVRAVRTEMNVPPSVKTGLYIQTEYTNSIEKTVQFIKKLAFADKIEFVKNAQIDTVTAITTDAKVYIPLSQIIDKEKELARLEKERQITQKDIEFLQNKLNNAGFLAKAPKELVENQQNSLAKANEKLQKILSGIEQYK